MGSPILAEALVPAWHRQGWLPLSDAQKISSWDWTIPIPGIVKARLEGTLSTLVHWELSLPMARGWTW